MNQDNSKLTLLEWGINLQKKLNEQELQVPNFDVNNLQREKKEMIVWTKKLYDIHRHDRFMTLVKLEEK